MRFLQSLLVALSILLPGCSETACPARVVHEAPAPERLVTATGYSFREPAHRAYGRHNCEGGILDDTQVAADTRYYPLGTVLWIEGLGRRIVTDRGSDVVGPRHIDIHFCSLDAMAAWGTRLVHIRILSRP